MLSTKHVHAPLDLKLILRIGLAYENIYSSLLTEYDRQLNRKKNKKYNNREDTMVYIHYQTQKRRQMLGNKTSIKLTNFL